MPHSTNLKLYDSGQFTPPHSNLGGCGFGGVVSPDGVAPTRPAGASASIITPGSITNPEE